MENGNKLDEERTKSGLADEKNGQWTMKRIENGKWKMENGI